jgi:hypothetical protein
MLYAPSIFLLGTPSSKLNNGPSGQSSMVVASVVVVVAASAVVVVVAAAVVDVVAAAVVVVSSRGVPRHVEPRLCTDEVSSLMANNSPSEWNTLHFAIDPL